MASELKRRKVQTETENSPSASFSVRHWISAILSLCTNNYMTHISLTPLKIKNCNATASGGTPFSKAFCETKHYDEGLVFGDLFQKGMGILVNYVQKKTLPASRQHQVVLQKLLDFLDGERSINVHDPQRLQSLTKTEHTILVSNHLLGKLSTSSCYLVDKNFSGKKGDWCFCSNEACELTGQYGDTSIGHVEVWHGNLDIIINNDLAVYVDPLDEQPESHGGKSDVEAKIKTALSKNPQIIAQTIVFSFVQKKTHPEREHFLTPCIGISSTELLVMFYDSEHDVLLESCSIPLFKDSVSGEFSYTAILVCWLTVNYKFLCTGRLQNVKEYTSDFFVHANEKMKVYEEKLQLGNIGWPLSNEGKLKFSPRVKCTPLMHEYEKVFQEMLWKLDDATGTCSSST